MRLGKSAFDCSKRRSCFGGSVGIVPDDRRGGPEGGAALTSGQQLLAVGGKRERVNSTQLDAAGIQLHQFAPRLDIPEADRLVSCCPTPGCDHPAKTPRPGPRWNAP